MEINNVIDTFIIILVCILAIIAIRDIISCCVCKSPTIEPFADKKYITNDVNPVRSVKINFDDTVVNQTLGYTDLTKYYSNMDNSLKETPIVNISAIETNRFPIIVEDTTNWYDTQGLIVPGIKLGTDNGKLPNSECFCDGGPLDV
jgi:hypothetical protein